MSWICPLCSTSNTNEQRICFVCSHERGKIRASVKEQIASYQQGLDHYNKGNYEVAFEYLVFAAEQGYLPALLQLADCYLLGRGTEANPRKCYETLIRAAKKGNQEAQHMVAMCYCEGYGTSKHFPRAISWLEKAAAQNYLPSIKRLASMYFQGQGADPNVARALELYRRAAKLAGGEDPEIELGLGNCYDALGRYFQASQYYKKAARAGNSEAQYALGRCYEQGRGVFRNAGKARHWYTLSANNGYAEASEALRNFD